MSIDAVNQFLEKVAQDSKIQEELAQVMEAEDHRQAAVELGAKHGFEFTSEELMTEVEKRQQAAIESGQLSEEELEAVAGGIVIESLASAAVIGAVSVTGAAVIGAASATGAALIGKAKW
ncbi:MAG: Nif11-like leader peptide family natural product precursor [Rivularia sp. (in: cyanobacteria)]